MTTTGTRLDGGGAFPLDLDYGTQAGMSLRDYFAGQALAGMCTGFNGGIGDSQWFKQYGVKSAYEIADAMLEARD